jgi:AcrR family transcriptional regulator
VAREAEISEGTVYNYFPTKEDLFYAGMEAFEAELVEAVRDRPPGESVPAAFRRFVLDRSARLVAADATQVIATAAHLVGASPALQKREREIVAHYTHSLAALVAEETGSDEHDIEPLVVASALMGVQRALVELVRSLVVEGHSGPRLAARMSSQAERAFARLEHGLGDYATR